MLRSQTVTPDVEPKVKSIINRMFDLPDDTVTRSTTAADVDGWDSLSHINLIVAIEREFRIKFTTSEVVSLKNVGELVDLVAKKTS